MILRIETYNILLFLNNITEPNLDDVDVIKPAVMASIVLMVISLMFPCLVWFMRNFMRIVLKKNYEWFNRSIKWILFFSLVLFIISIILIVLATQGII